MAVRGCAVCQTSHVDRWRTFPSHRGWTVARKHKTASCFPHKMQTGAVLLRALHTACCTRLPTTGGMMRRCAASKQTVAPRLPRSERLRRRKRSRGSAGGNSTLTDRHKPSALCCCNDLRRQQRVVPLVPVGRWRCDEISSVRTAAVPPPLMFAQLCSPRKLEVLLGWSDRAYGTR